MRDVRVLIVDDEPDIRATVSAMLEIEGYEVAEAANGADALHALEDRLPDVILLDMRMPVLDGWGFAAELPAKPADELMSEGFGAKYRDLLQRAGLTVQRFAEVYSQPIVLRPTRFLDYGGGGWERGAAMAT